jgi:hypothetical protein
VVTVDAPTLAEALAKVFARQHCSLDALTIKHDANGVTITVKASGYAQLSLLGIEDDE